MNVQNRNSYLNSLPLTPVQSSQIHSIGYDPASSTLVIQFPRKGDSGPEPGSKYSYSNFTQEDYDAFMAAESKGSHFIKNIKNKDQYPYQKLVLEEAQEQQAA